MTPVSSVPCAHKRPSLSELGPDLTRVSPGQRAISLLGPFIWAAAYFSFASHHRRIAAVGCLVVLSFVTYGSVSHDLVHCNLGLTKRTNNLFLIIIELLALRSGTAYRLAHLNHHRRFPADDDIEGAAARMSLVAALAEGVRFQARIYLWSWKQFPKYRKELAFEGFVIASAYAVSILTVHWSHAALIYTVLMTAGAWSIPVITSWIPHEPTGSDELHQTRAFRGLVLKIIAFEHLYHLEHHLYPAVPHHNWPRLASRLDPFLNASGIRPQRLWF